MRNALHFLHMFSRLIGYFFVSILYAIGPVLLLIAVGSSIPTIRFVAASIATDGTVCDLNRVYLPRRSKEVYLPVFLFIANDGQSHMVMADSNAGWVPLKRGDHVRVLYLKDHPETARIDTIPQLWMPQLIVAVVGALFTVICVHMFRRRRSPRSIADTG